MKKLIWMSYDLGLKGDYENLYDWLDSHQAKECGDNLAAFEFEFEHDLLKELAEDLKTKVQLDKANRIYVIYPYSDSPGSCMRRKGKFLFGKRKPAPWSGYATRYEEDIDDEE